MMIPKPRTARSRRYRNYVSGQDCVGCLKNGPSDPHHLESGAMGMQKSDYILVPLCRKCHTLYHSKGQRWFEDSFGVNLYRQALFCLERYITEELNIQEIEDER